jgi:hypothetical protein
VEDVIEALVLLRRRVKTSSTALLCRRVEDVAVRDEPRLLP